jgi:hypothetical protein
VISPSLHVRDIVNDWDTGTKWDYGTVTLMRSPRNAVATHIHTSYYRAVCYIYNTKEEPTGQGTRDMYPSKRDGRVGKFFDEAVEVEAEEDGCA